MTRTTNRKVDLARQITGVANPERDSLASSRDKIYEKFYHNIRVLTAAETLSLVDISRLMNLHSGSRLYLLTVAKGKPSAEELIIIAKYFNITLDDLLNKTAKITFE